MRTCRVDDLIAGARLVGMGTEDILALFDELDSGVTADERAPPTMQSR